MHVHVCSKTQTGLIADRGGSEAPKPQAPQGQRRGAFVCMSLERGAGVYVSNISLIYIYVSHLDRHVDVDVEM